MDTVTEETAALANAQFHGLRLQAEVEGPLAALRAGARACRRCPIVRPGMDRGVEAQPVR
ncbi:MAG: hypothetical protein ACRDNT_20255 [Streptosporangiaceae bacterium]